MFYHLIFLHKKHNRYKAENDQKIRLCQKTSACQIICTYLNQKWEIE